MKTEHMISLSGRSPWVFGKKSEIELLNTVDAGGYFSGVHPKLQAVTRLALAISACDFGIHDGVRTDEEHAANVAAGTSRARRSKHLDGLAVDAVPWVYGVWSWAKEHCFKVAKAHQRASVFLRIPIIWGGNWNYPLGDLCDPETAHKMYVFAFERDNPGKKALIDLVHFELVVP